MLHRPAVHTPSSVESPLEGALQSVCEVAKRTTWSRAERTISRRHRTMRMGSARFGIHSTPGGRPDFPVWNPQPQPHQSTAETNTLRTQDLLWRGQGRRASAAPAEAAGAQSPAPQAINALTMNDRHPHRRCRPVPRGRARCGRTSGARRIRGAGHRAARARRSKCGRRCV